MAKREQPNQSNSHFSEYFKKNVINVSKLESHKTEYTSPNCPSPSFSLKVSLSLGNSFMEESVPAKRFMLTAVMEGLRLSEDSCRLMMSASA